MLTRSKLSALVLLAAVFISGAVVGGVVSAAWGDGEGSRDRDRDRRRERSYVEHLQQELDLTAAQRDSVERILETYQESMAELWADIRPRMHEIRARVRADIANVLDEDQRAAYERHNARSDSARAARNRKREDRR